MKISRVVVSLSLVFIITGCSHSAVNDTAGAPPTATLAGRTFELEIAQTGEERAKGLSGRESLEPNKGMLFIFPGSGIYSFWMRGMLFPLDIIWIEEGLVVDIWANAPVPGKGNIPFYKPKAKASFVLEVEAGFVDEKGLKIGDPVNLDLK